MVEVPVAVHPRFKIAGGFYARLLPKRVIEWGVNALNSRDVPAVLYFHPWEFSPDVRSADPPIHARFISYHGLDRTEGMLDRLLSKYHFGTVEEVVGTDSP